ncbi:hypothetical protein L1049_017593 [Liquidambar formosana]|uniref:F-box domain-containing protein n=1 Tax=Liquidambar formosana TaxID=63359 RepID=A0AAP0X8B3_LIQFO
MWRMMRMKARNILFNVTYGTIQVGFVFYRLVRVGLYELAMCGLGQLIKHGLHPRLLKTKRRCRRRGEESDELKTLSSSSRWSDHLPEEVMELILQRLCLNDYLRFSAVCSSWRSVVAKAISNKRCRPTPHFPLIMFGVFAYKNLNARFLDLCDKGRVSMPCRENLYGRYCCGSVEGWLILTDGFMWRPEGFFNFWSPSSLFKFEMVNNYFFNPVTGAKVMLPSQSTIPIRRSYISVYFFVKVVASSVPTNPNCVVVGICRFNGMLVFCRPSDKAWTLTQTSCLLDVVIHGGKVFGITSSRAAHFIVVIDLLGAAPGCILKPKRFLIPQPQIDAYAFCRRQGYTRVATNKDLIHLVQDFASGEVLMVVQTVDFVYKHDSLVRPMFQDFIVPPKVKHFRVFKLDRSWPRWIQVESLGDRILFVSFQASMCVSATSLSLADPTIRGNCIIFAYDYICRVSPSSGCDVGVFYLADESFRRLPTSNCAPSVFHPIWFTPNL